MRRGSQRKGMKKYDCNAIRKWRHHEGHVSHLVHSEDVAEVNDVKCVLKIILLNELGGQGLDAEGATGGDVFGLDLGEGEGDRDLSRGLESTASIGRVSGGPVKDVRGLIGGSLRMKLRNLEEEFVGEASRGVLSRQSHTRELKAAIRGGNDALGAVWDRFFVVDRSE
jgi:hypothetical protein